MEETTVVPVGAEKSSKNAMTTYALNFHISFNRHRLKNILKKKASDFSIISARRSFNAKRNRVSGGRSSQPWLKAIDLSQSGKSCSMGSGKHLKIFSATISRKLSVKFGGARN